MKKITKLLLSASLVLSAASLSAAPLAAIDPGSKLGFTGTLRVVDIMPTGSFDGTSTTIDGVTYAHTDSLLDAKGIDFAPDRVKIELATASFSHLAPTTFFDGFEYRDVFKYAMFKDFIFNPYSGGVDPLWYLLDPNTVTYDRSGGASFENYNYTSDTLQFALGGIKVEQDQEKVNGTLRNTLNIYGNGMISGGGFVATSGTWNLSVSQDDPDSNGISDMIYDFTFEANSVSTSPIPEPSTYALFGIAFIGLGIVGYRKRRA